MATLPANVSLANIADGANIVASDHRNNYSSAQTYINALNAILSAGTTGQFFKGVGTTVSFDYPPGYEYGYTEFTGSQSVTNTVEASSDTVVTASAITFDGSTRICIEFFSPNVQPDTAAAGRRIQIALFDGVTSLGFLTSVYGQVAGVAYAEPVLVRRFLTPAAAAKTYSIRARVSAGTGSVSGGAGGAGVDNPCYIRITKA